MSNQKYLVKETNVFVDPHGSPDGGGERKFVWEYDRNAIESGDTIDYPKLNKKYTNTWGEDEILEEYELQGSEDGYNSEYLYFEVKKITDEQYELYKQIILDYNSIK
jgi:hypothetical protein